MTTESTLRDWRYGQAQAERLVAALLHLEGFDAVDPQHPLGGPDGLKDVKCQKDGLSWIAGAYFPTTKVDLTKIKAKFSGDFVGVKKNGAQAFAFFVNQPLTVGEREEVLKLADGTRTELYHLERIRSLLDAPKGCGIRLEYLRIPMTEEEQWAFWSTVNHDLVKRLADNEIRRDAQMRSVEEKLEAILERTNALEFALTSSPSSLIAAPYLENTDLPTASLSATTLCWIHRVLTENTGIPESVRGRFRSLNVWIGPKGSTPETATYIPPPPEELLDLTNEWIHWWKEEHRRVQSLDKEKIVIALAEFHYRLLRIHPFLDANGRLARSLLDQAARELLNQGIGSEFTQDAEDYYKALHAADEGDMNPLRSRIAAALR